MAICNTVGTGRSWQQTGSMQAERRWKYAIAGHTSEPTFHLIRAWSRPEFKLGWGERKADNISATPKYQELSRSVVLRT